MSMESFPQPNQEPEQNPEQNTESKPAQQEKPPMMALEAENQFDDLWIAAAEAKGFISRADGNGRILEKDGMTLKLNHFKFTSSGKIQYNAIFTDFAGVPKSFPFKYEKVFKAAAIEKILTETIEKYSASLPKSSPVETKIDVPGYSPTMERGVEEKYSAIDAYRPFIEKGITDPISIPAEEETDAKGLYEKWVAHIEEQKAAAATPADKLWLDFEVLMFYLDAGFTDVQYVEETLFDHAQQYLDQAEQISKDVATRMVQTIKYYHQKLIPTHQWEY